MTFIEFHADIETIAKKVDAANALDDLFNSFGNIYNDYSIDDLSRFLGNGLDENGIKFIQKLDAFIREHFPDRSVS